MPGDEQALVNEKTLEINICAEILQMARSELGSPTACLHGMDQTEESITGVDSFLEGLHGARCLGLQFKAAKWVVPYRYTLERDQHAALHSMAQLGLGSVFYILPALGLYDEFHGNLPNLMNSTWALPVDDMQLETVFPGEQETRRVRLDPLTGIVTWNPQPRARKLESALRQALSEKGGLRPDELRQWYQQRARNAGKEGRKARGPGFLLALSSSDDQGD